MQNHYNLAYREEEREMFPTLKVRFHLLSPPSIPIDKESLLFTL